MTLFDYNYFLSKLFTKIVPNLWFARSKFDEKIISLDFFKTYQIHGLFDLKLHNCNQATFEMASLASRAWSIFKGIVILSLFFLTSAILIVIAF
jgi:hypothetical protein